MRYLEPILKQILLSNNKINESMSLGEKLIFLGLIRQEQLDKALVRQKEVKKEIGEILVEMGVVSQGNVDSVSSNRYNEVKYNFAILGLDTDDDMLRYLITLGYDKSLVMKNFELYYGISYIDLTKLDIDDSMRDIFNLDTLISKSVLPYRYDKESNTFYMAIYNFGSTDIKKSIEFILFKKGAKAEYAFALEGEIIGKYNELKDRQLKDESEGFIVSKDTVEAEPEIIADGDGFAVLWVRKIIDRGIKIGCSDIHIEPFDKYLQVRYRVDGLLTKKENYVFTEEEVKNITSRIKIVSGMNIAEVRKPQDGRMESHRVGGDVFDIRVSTVATVYGEKVVMRVLDKTSSILTFEQLGYEGNLVDSFNRVLKYTYGTVYLAGPTGSGKTTTLYTMIKAINKDEINIYTIEDPVEKNLRNVNQVQINELSGITYPVTLRALMRQDPDVIIVGEIRDSETAELTIRASQTGHLVLATVHANNALQTISRMINMDVDPFLLSVTSLAFASQRLVRVLCKACKKERKANKMENKWLDTLHNEFGVDVKDTYYGAVGCDECEGTGYKGRTVIGEVLIVSDDLKMAIAEKQSIPVIERMVYKAGFEPIILDGFKKVKSGVTSVEEIMRVI